MLMTPRMLRSPLREDLSFLALHLGFGACGAFILHNGSSLGWAILVPFVLMLPLNLVPLLPESNYLRLDADGITLRRIYQDHRFLWSEISSFRVCKYGLRRIVCFDYSDEVRRKRSARARARSAHGDGQLLESYGLETEELAQLLNWNREESLGKFEEEDCAPKSVSHFGARVL